MKGKLEKIVWVAVFTVVIVVQWPMLKGMYYRAAGRAAPASSIQWQTRLDHALVEAVRTGKHVLVDFSADWCPPCIAMQHDVWPDPEVGRAVNRRYVPLMVDVDRNAEVADLYKVTSIPTILVLDSNGRVVREASLLSSRSAAAMLEFLSDGQ